MSIPECRFVLTRLNRGRTVSYTHLMQIGKIFYSDFGLFYQVPQNSGSLYAVTNTIDTYVDRKSVG